jgi:hypothetical protein
MNFKFALLTAFCLGTILESTAQTSDAEADAIVNLLGVQKKEAISKLVPVTGKDSIAFWKIYDEYRQLNKPNAKARIGLYEKTAQSYRNMTPAIADSLAGKYFANRMDQEKTLEVYYKKIKDATNAVTAFEFYQAEVYLLTQLRAQIMQQVPHLWTSSVIYQKELAITIVKSCTKLFLRDNFKSYHS